MRESKTPNVWISLPVPDKEVVGYTEEDAVRMRYIESIEKISKCDAETLIEIAKMKNNCKIKLALILAGIVALGIGSIWKLKIEGKAGNNSVTIEPK